MKEYDNYGMATIIAVVFTGLYYFINSIIIVNINQVINFIFMGLIFISVFIGVNKLYNGKFVLFNRDYLKVLDKLRAIYHFFAFNQSYESLAYIHDNYLIKEGNKYSTSDKFLFIIIRLGIISIITILWYIIIYNDTIFARNPNTIQYFVIISVFVSIILLVFMPVIIPISNYKKKVNLLGKNSN